MLRDSKSCYEFDDNQYLGHCSIAYKWELEPIEAAPCEILFKVASDGDSLNLSASNCKICSRRETYIQDTHYVCKKNVLKTTSCFCLKRDGTVANSCGFEFIWSGTAIIFKLNIK